MTATLFEDTGAAVWVAVLRVEKTTAFITLHVYKAKRAEKLPQKYSVAVVM